MDELRDPCAKLDQSLAFDSTWLELAKVLPRAEPRLLNEVRSTGIGALGVGVAARELL